MKKDKNIRFHSEDLPNLDYYQVDCVAIDTETLGLNLQRDRLCLVQLSPGDGSVDIVQIKKDQTTAPNLQALLQDVTKTKIFHFARFDLAVLEKTFGEIVPNIYCTKVASKLVRTYTDRHGLKELCLELLNVQLCKQQQSSDWGRKDLTEAQLDYAASDVLYLHALKNILDEKLLRDGRINEAQACFDFLPVRAHLDLLGWADKDIFSHN